MCDPQRLKGWWFLPSAPTERVPGVLTWSQEQGADLELIGGLSGEHEQVSKGAWHIDGLRAEVKPCTIYGETDAGKSVTLWQAERGGYKESIRLQMREEFWHSSWVCVGAHIPCAESTVLSELRAAMDSLYDLTEDGRFGIPQWCQIEGVERPGEEQEDGTLLLPYVVPVIGGLRAGYSSASTDTTTYSIDTYATQPPANPATEAMPNLKLDMMTKRTRGGRALELLVGAWVRVAPLDSAPSSASDLLGRMRPLLDLMSLTTFTGGAVEWAKAETVDGEDVSLLCHLGHPSSPDAPATPRGVVFTLDDLPLEQFLRTRQRLTSGHQARYAWNVAVGLIGHSPRLVEEHVSQVLAAAEGFHRWCLGGTANPSLKKRLSLLHDCLPEEVAERLQLDVDKWAGWAAWARNHVNHGGAEKHREVEDFFQLKVIADSVRLVTYLVVLKELSVPVAKMQDALLNHPRISVLVGRCADIANLPELSFGEEGDSVRP